MGEQDLGLAVVRQLAVWGVKEIFGVAGDDILPLLDALNREGGIRYIGTTHEAGAGFMASNRAKLTGELGVCMASAAGSINLLDGLADAYLDGAPVLAITGQIPTTKIGTQTKQYFNQQQLFSNMSGYSELVTDANTAISLLVRAMSQSQLRRTVAHLSFPGNIWSQKVRVETRPKPMLITKQSSVPFGDWDYITSLMSKAHHPLVVIGIEGKEAENELQHLVSLWGAAVVVAQDAKGVVPDNWPEVIGGIGEARMPDLIRNADCILLIGAASYETMFLPKVPVIQLKTWPWEINEKYLWESLTGDIQKNLAVLTERLKGFNADVNWKERINTEKKQWQAAITSDLEKNDGNTISPAKMMAVLNRVVANDAIIAMDQGGFTRWFNRDFLASKQQILLSSLWRNMGAGLPGAIAAQLAYPEKQVIALVGDGGLLMSLGELKTVAQNKLPIRIIVANNHLYGLEKDKSIKENLAPLGLEVQSPDFSLCAKAFGIKGFKVSVPELLEPILKEALSEGGPTLVDVACNYVTLPMMIGNSQ